MKPLNPTSRLLLVLTAAGLLIASRSAVASVDGVDGTVGHYWSSIKADTYEQREHFASGVRRLSERLDKQIAELRAKRATLTTDVADWDLQMKEVDNSHSLLASRIADLAKTTTPEAWEDAKQKIGEAWKRSQDAVDKMNSTRTS